ncbi:MAG: hypothetical protein WBP81_19915 [Solirubrobacteraceae bacterium]
MNRAVATAAAADEPQLRRAYSAAVAHGSRNTQCSAPEERAYGTLRLLTLATLRLPDLFLYAHVLQVFDEDPAVERVPPVVVGAVRTIGSDALRLAHRALETHARNVGYETGAWVDRALEQAGACLCCQVDVEVPVLLDQARRATIALTRATATTADDRMLVPEELANGLGHLLAIYLIATTIG